jgi:hypothetical protein
LYQNEPLNKFKVMGSNYEFDATMGLVEADSLVSETDFSCFDGWNDACGTPTQVRASHVLHRRIDTAWNGNTQRSAHVNSLKALH